MSPPANNTPKDSVATAAHARTGAYSSLSSDDLVMASLPRRDAGKADFAGRLGIFPLR